MLSLGQIFHTAYVVRDLDRAIVQLEAALDVSFLAPVQRDVPRVHDFAGDGPLSTCMTYSRGAPPYIELIEAAGSGFLSQDTAGHTHHLGLWVEDPAEASQFLRRRGYGWTADIYDAEGRIAVAFVRDGAQVYELVRETRRPALEDWIAGRETSHRIG